MHMELGRNKAHEMQRFGFPHLQVPAVYIKEHSSLTNLKGNTLIDQNEVGQSQVYQHILVRNSLQDNICSKENFVFIGKMQ